MNRVKPVMLALGLAETLGNMRWQNPGSPFIPAESHRWVLTTGYRW